MIEDRQKAFVLNSVAPRWIPTSEHPDVFVNGDKYLVALQVKNNETNKTNWEFHLIECECDEDFGPNWYSFADGVRVENFDVWTWDDFEYYIMVKE